MLSTSHKKIYPAASVDDAVKTALAELYLVQAKNGMTRVVAGDTASPESYWQRLFDRHVAAVEAGGTAISSEKDLDDRLS
ncbi:MAG: hypothetical protein IPH35_20190 [Rhodoferax sp.]|nr:hypothetical protein [Rhodoferax sp.]